MKDAPNALAPPGSSALLTVEVQRGTIGDHSPFEELVVAARQSGLVEELGRLLPAARAAGVRIVHCTARFRRDLAGSGANSPLLSAMTRHPDHIVEGSPGAELCSGIFAEPDIVCSRLHGVSPFTGTDLDALLRNSGISTVVVSGVSVNLAIIGACIEAVNLGYRVVLPVDAVAGFPTDYVEEVVSRTLSLVATRTTVDELVNSWSSL